jgi:hypothetical protein
MAYTEAAKPHIFLSSVFSEQIDGEWTYVPLRRRILDKLSQFACRCLGLRYLWPKNSETPELDADMIVDRCFAGVHNCGLFVFPADRAPWPPLVDLVKFSR